MTIAKRNKPNHSWPQQPRACDAMVEQALATKDNHKDGADRKMRRIIERRVNIARKEFLTCT